VLSSKVVGTDDTPVKVLDRPWNRSDPEGTKAIQGVKMGTAIGPTGVFSNDTSTPGSISTGLSVVGIVGTLAGATPIVGQILSGASIVVDIISTGIEISKCNLVTI
jgi:hypothetical protein